MNILFLVNDDEGIYKFRREIIQTLLKDNEVFISLPDGYYVSKMVEMGCKFIDTQFNRKGTNPLKDIELVNKYRKIIRDNKIDVVLTYTIKPIVYGGIACQLEHIPYIANITGLSSVLEKEGLLKTIVANLYKVGLRKAKTVFFQNQANLDFMLNNKIIKKNYSLIPGSGVNLKEFEVLEYPNNGVIEFTYIARIMKEKGIEQYFDAAKYIKNKYPNTVFNICGTYDEEEYKPIVEELDKQEIVKYHGQVLDMKEIYKRISCTIHASFYSEGLSNALLETLASGRPIITTDKPGCKELVIDGVNGFMIKQKDSQDLIDKIEKFVSLSYEERKKMGLAGRKLVEEKYSRDIVISKYLEVINSVK